MPLSMPGKAVRTSYFGTVDGEASTSISGLPRKTLFAISTIFPAPQGKHQELSWAMYVCEYLLLEESLSLSTAHLRPSGFTACTQSFHGALRGPRGAPRMQCTHLPTGAGCSWDESVAHLFTLCQRHEGVTAGAVLVRRKSCNSWLKLRH